MSARELDPMAALGHLLQWAGQYYDDASPAHVTDVLIVFAFMAGLSIASVDQARSAELFRRLVRQCPEAGRSAAALGMAIARISASCTPKNDAISPEWLCTRELSTPSVRSFGWN